MVVETEQQHNARKRLEWRRTAPGMASLALFALVALSLLAATSLILFTVSAERAERAQVAQTRDVLDALRQIVSAISANLASASFSIRPINCRWGVFAVGSSRVFNRRMAVG